MKKRGQITVFVIVAIFIIVAGSFYFIFRDAIKQDTIPSNIAPIHTSVLSCVEDIGLGGISFLESTGGYIELPEFNSGSRAAPFSSQLNFAGIEIPYWNYISASGLEKEQIPSLEEMETQLENYIESRILKCDLSQYEDAGFLILKSSPKAEVKIKDNFIDINLKMNLEIKKEDETFLVEDFDLRIDSSLGDLYSESFEIYDKEKDELFLEEYSIDVLGLYAPLDGIEISCSPKSWNAMEIFEDLEFALESNIHSISNQKDRKDYFYQNVPSDFDVNFLTSFDNFPSYFEVNPSEGPLMVAEPIGNQQELGVLGFCYVPYHFVYDVKYPVLIQLSKNGETFQFPMVVLIEGNSPRTSERAYQNFNEEENFCKNSNAKMNISVYGYEGGLDPIDAKISYQCSGFSCYLGESSQGILEAMVPQCYQGKLVVESEGYKKSTLIQSSIKETNVLVILDKEYTKKINLLLGDVVYSNEAVISFDDGEKIQTILYPTQNEVSLSEGNYEVQVYVYENSILELEETISEQCIEVSSGIKGIFGGTKKECFDVEIPSNLVTNALSGGGSEIISVKENELLNSNYLEIKTVDLGTPSSFEDLQKNYILFENSKLEVNFI
ncbi:MAG: hypothetical protein U9Q99_01225 [Nanoarchaeota archaeon]|nr:hypothetical protein [Nanoarchaeota archaeon]